MEATKFHDIMDSIEKVAEGIGTWINRKSTKIGFGVAFGFMVVTFGTITFISKFSRSIFGIKQEK